MRSKRTATAACVSIATGSGFFKPVFSSLCSVFSRVVLF